MPAISPALVAGAVAVAAIAWQAHGWHAEKLAHAATINQYSKKQKEADDAYIATIEEYRARESKWSAAIAAADVEGIARLRIADDAAGRLAAERDGLRDQYRRALIAQASTAACPAADAADRQTAADAANLHADLFWQLDARAAALAAIADTQHAAAVNCWNAATIGR